MKRYLLRRVAAMTLVMLVITSLVFALSHRSGDPRIAYLSPYSRLSAEEWDAMGRKMGLDKPLVAQYGLWLSKAARGDLGESVNQHVSSMSLIRQSLAATLQLAIASFVVALAVGISLGVLSATKRGTLLDYLARGFALTGQAVPPFWLALMLIFLFAVRLEWLPASRRGDWTHYVLPVTTLAWLASSGLLRLTRSAMLEVLDSEYVKFARAKGVQPWIVIWKHALRNALGIPLTYAAVLIGGFITGAVIIETVFAWPGIGRLSVQAALNNDFPLVTGLALFFSFIFLMSSLLADLCYALLDPRIRYD